MRSPLLVWDERMLAYDLGGHHPLHPVRWALTWQLADRLGVLDGIDLVAPRPADDSLLERIHTPGYVAAVKAASGPEGRRSRHGHGLGTSDNPVFPGMHDAAALIAGGSVTAARAIAAGTVDRAVSLAGGLHHAMADAASGFCVYNDAALAVAALLDAGVERVAYVDIDVHHGDGVQTAFYDDPRVLTVSLHESPATLFPGTGWPGETGGPGAIGTAVNVALPAGTADRGWLRAFRAVVPGALRAFRPQVLVSQQGADSHLEDPLADLALTVDGHLAAYREIRALAQEHTGGRWLALGGGGYAVTRVVPRSWTHLLAVVAERDVDPRTAIPADWQATAAAARPGVAPPESMTDGTPDGFDVRPWDGSTSLPVDRAVLDTRRSAFPLLGLDPDDPRD
jgi:acetoin utilization protein AcuC